MYPEGPHVPSDFDRSGSDGDLFDPLTGSRIGDLDEYGSWSRGPDGTAIRDNDPASPFNPLSPLRQQPTQSSRKNVDDEDDGDEEVISILLLS